MSATVVSWTPFGYDLEMLRAFMEHHKSVVDVFVVSESNFAFNGDPKPLVARDNIAALRKIAGNVVVAPLELAEFPQVSYFSFERLQREQSRDATLRFRNDNDHVRARPVVICSLDTDEFCNLDDLRAIKENPYRFHNDICGAFQWYVGSFLRRKTAPWHSAKFRIVMPNERIPTDAEVRWRVPRSVALSTSLQGPLPVQHPRAHGETVFVRGWHATWLFDVDQKYTAQRAHVDGALGTSSLPEAMTKLVADTEELDKIADDIPPALHRFFPPLRIILRGPEEAPASDWLSEESGRATAPEPPPCTVSPDLGFLEGAQRRALVVTSPPGELPSPAFVRHAIWCNMRLGRVLRDTASGATAEFVDETSKE
jgi:hypothetical protein